MKIGILKTDSVREELVEHHGEYPDMFSELLQLQDPELHFTTYDAVARELPGDLHAADAYLITGSRHSVYDDADWIAELGDFVRELHWARKKLVGICFGHQLVAHFLGGRVALSEKGWGIGLHTTQLHESPVHSELEDVVRLLYSHQDQVEAAAHGGEVLGGSDFCPIAITRIDNHVLTFQGHPEFSPAYSRALFELRSHLYPPERYEAALRDLEAHNDSHAVARWIVNFFRDQAASIATP